MGSRKKRREINFSIAIPHVQTAALEDNGAHIKKGVADCLERDFSRA